MSRFVLKATIQEKKSKLFYVTWEVFFQKDTFMILYMHVVFG